MLEFEIFTYGVLISIVGIFISTIEINIHSINFRKKEKNKLKNDEK